MKDARILLLTLCFLSSSVLCAQNKPLVKLELAAGLLAEPFTEHLVRPMPGIHIPITRHLDIGVGYVTTRIHTQDLDESYSYGPDGSFAADTGQHYQFNHNFASLLLTWNFSNPKKVINPVLGYIISTTKGKATFPANSTQTPKAQTDIQNLVGKSVIVHGAQAGFDVRISRIVSILARGRIYHLNFDKDGSPLYDQVNPSPRNLAIGEFNIYGMLGGIIKFHGSKKKRAK